MSHVELPFCLYTVGERLKQKLFRLDKYSLRYSASKSRRLITSQQERMLINIAIQLTGSPPLEWWIRKKFQTKRKKCKRALHLLDIWSSTLWICGLPLVLRHDPVPRWLLTSLWQGMKHWSRDGSTCAPGWVAQTSGSARIFQFVKVSWSTPTISEKNCECEWLTLKIIIHIFFTKIHKKNLLVISFSPFFLDFFHAF